jgi:uncharacterized OB-fold protein
MNSPKIYSYTILCSAAVEFAARTPFVCAVIEDADGKRASCILEGWKEGVPVQIGMSVKEIPGKDGKQAFSL